MNHHLGTFSRSQDSDSSSSEGEASGSIYRSVQNLHQPHGDTTAQYEGSASEETTDDEAIGSRASEKTAAINRPQSSLSVDKYRTPGTSSAPLPTPGVPALSKVSETFQPLEARRPFPCPLIHNLIPNKPSRRDLMASAYRRPPSTRSHALSRQRWPICPVLPPDLRLNGP